ncbi:MAG: Hsp20/alpha crystallin family protein [Candidatus Cloacimonetes bacterium]|nr:Hsp20/alpha crystallin family protein [Candidatus Cloacimonadota bacterium]
MPFKQARDLHHLSKQMQRLLDGKSSPPGMRLPGEDTWQPRCDVYVTDNHFHVVIDLAGVERRSLRITTAEDHLEVIGERAFTHDRKNAYYYTIEIETGRFLRRIPFFDEPVDRDHLDVQYETGLLHIIFNLRPNEERDGEFERQ